jgi:nucleoside-diphosphate-sugar epimerase
MEIPPEQWRPVYNVGAGRTCNIVDIAHMAVTEARSRNGGRESQVIIQRRDVPRMFGQDTTLFCKDTGWNPELDMHDTLVTLMDYYSENAFATE